MIVLVFSNAILNRLPALGRPNEVSTKLPVILLFVRVIVSVIMDRRPVVVKVAATCAFWKHKKARQFARIRVDVGARKGVKQAHK